MTTATEETIEEFDQEFAERVMCECSHASPDGIGVACEFAAEFEVTVMCPDDRCTDSYLLCGECRSQWARHLPRTHLMRARRLD